MELAHSCFAVISVMIGFGDYTELVFGLVCQCAFFFYRIYCVLFVESVGITGVGGLKLLSYN